MWYSRLLPVGSMETDQPQEDSVEAEATGDFHLTDDDLSDTKDENVFSFLRKNKKSREEDK